MQTTQERQIEHARYYGALAAYYQNISDVMLSDIGAIILAGPPSDKKQPVSRGISIFDFEKPN